MIKGKIFFIMCLFLMCSVLVFAEDKKQPTVNFQTKSEVKPEVKPEAKKVPIKVDPSLLEISTQGSEDYTLGVNDVIEVKVMRHPEVSGEYPVNNAGKIQYEFVGDLGVQGMAKKQVQDMIVTKLADYIISPEVTVTIKQYNSKVVYVIGEVSSPGKIYMRGNTITVREALIQAGLPLLSAKLEKGKLITPSTDGQPVNRPVNIDKLLIKGDLRENLVMLPGDSLYVPPTILAKVMRVISPITAPIGNVGGAAGAARTAAMGGL
ncbi:MAG: polysaccharide export protein [Candidatus Omnitrophica bacterium]|nr:polysaccharide export protein [Candidatus Omnitrophota bacterium]